MVSREINIQAIQELNKFIEINNKNIRVLLVNPDVRVFLEAYYKDDCEFTDTFKTDRLFKYKNTMCLEHIWMPTIVNPVMRKGHTIKFDLNCDCCVCGLK